jgi:hypothetical protein
MFSIPAIPELYNTLLDKYIYQWNSILNILSTLGIIGLVFYLTNIISTIYFPKIINFFLAKRLLVNRGFGLFSPKTLEAILLGKCSICNSSIDNNSIFGNSLIIKNMNVR